MGEWIWNRPSARPFDKLRAGDPAYKLAAVAGRTAVCDTILSNPPFPAWFSYATTPVYPVGAQSCCVPLEGSYATTPVYPVGAQSCCVPLEGATSLRQGYGTAGKIAPLPFGCGGAALGVLSLQNAPVRAG